MAQAGVLHQTTAIAWTLIDKLDHHHLQISHAMQLPTARIHGSMTNSFALRRVDLAHMTDQHVTRRHAVGVEPACLMRQLIAANPTTRA